MDNIYIFLRYHFKFCWHEASGQYNEYPVEIAEIDSENTDKDAYRRAFMTFASALIFKVDFIAPEQLTVKMCKEIVKEIK